MHRPYRLLLLAAVAVLTASGCASTAETPEEKKDEQRLVQEAPLGSRIRKRNNATPVLGASREDVERARVQQGAAATGVYQNPQKQQR
jgi:hypothetical protein